MSKEGLLNETNWINQDPVPTKAIMEQREKLYVSKQKALKASTNLFISKTRIQLRNLPRRDFYEKELKELMRVVAEEWSKTLTPEELKKQYRGKKVLNHVKIMRDEQKKDAAGEALPSGQAFVEFMNADLSMYAVRYLNNMEIVATKGLIVDFSMEDQRALFKRKEKIERWRQIAKDTKKANALDDEEEGYKNANSIDGKMQTIRGVVDLGASDEDEGEGEGGDKPSKSKKKGSINI